MSSQWITILQIDDALGHIDQMTAILDDIDSKILALLMDDARMPTATIARHVAIARTTAIARISALEKRGVIAGYGVRLNQAVFQPLVRAYVGISLDPRSAAAFVKTLQAMPEIETLCAVSGAMDYMVTLRCRSNAELDLLLDRIGTADGVRQTATSIILTHRIDRSPVPGQPALPTPQ
ncbi:MAG: DNA-binding Lrp family transcriptional regulator [Candidatus Paceibacteria bacterium]